jgi:membrane-associated phospholipid phosphatase
MAIIKLGLNDPEEVPKPVPLITVALILSLATAVLALVLFSWIAEEMLAGETARFDTTVRTWVHGFASPGMTEAMRIITGMGLTGLAVAVLIAFVAFLSLHQYRAAGWLGITLAGAVVLDVTLKHEFHRARPQPFFAAVPHSYSFPSGHSLFSFCVYGVLAGLITARVRSLWLRIVIWSATAALVLAIGLSRIYLGVHYPSDVVAGYLAATVWVSTLVLLDRVKKTRKGLKLTSQAEEP